MSKTTETPNASGDNTTTETGTKGKAAKPDRVQLVRNVGQYFIGNTFTRQQADALGFKPEDYKSFPNK